MTKSTGGKRQSHNMHSLGQIERSKSLRAREAIHLLGVPGGSLRKLARRAAGRSHRVSTVLEVSGSCKMSVNAFLLPRTFKERFKVLVCIHSVESLSTAVRV